VLIESSVFGPPAPTFESWRDRRRLDETFRPDVFRHEIGMLAKSIARPLDLDDGRIAPASKTRKTDGEPIVIRRAGDHVARRSLDFYEAVGRCLAGRGRTR
jgi:hypothetical protein